MKIFQFYLIQQLALKVLRQINIKTKYFNPKCVLKCNFSVFGRRNTNRENGVVRVRSLDCLFVIKLYLIGF